MKNKSMTALVSAFSRAYHSKNKSEKIFDDFIAEKLISQKEYSDISEQMKKGIAFFNPEFKGDEDEALEWIVDNQLSPSPLARAVFTENALKNEVMIGARQYLIMGAGYDTFAYRQPQWGEKIKIFEVDHPLMTQDKKERLLRADIVVPENVEYVSVDFIKESFAQKLIDNSNFDIDKITFCSMLGLLYYLPQKTFEDMLSLIYNIVPQGSSIVFDYPDELSYTDKAGERSKKQAMLAGGANENMLASYSYKQMEDILSQKGFKIYEHLTPNEMTEQYFKEYNKAYPDKKMSAFDNVNYCLAVKK